jgi:uncharacterized membrane protein
MRIAALVAFAAVMSVGTPALAQQQQTEIVFCNKTGSKIFTALAHVPQTTKKWTLTAWQTIPAGGCKSVARWNTALFYYYAEKEGRTVHWPAKAGVDKTFCVPSRAITREIVGGTCAAGERNVGFKGTVPNAGKYTINLNS